MSKPVGCKRWVIAEGFIPAAGHGPAPEMRSHEALSLLNAAEHEANVEITAYFSDREPAGPYRFTIPPRRTLRLRFNDLTIPEPIPTSTEFTSVVESDTHIVVQHTRLVSRQAEYALMTTPAYPDRPAS
jgi:hypothetical protein